MRRPGDGGFGVTQALVDLARVAGERGAEALAISPLHAMFSSDTQRYSPYSPSSRLFLNSLYCAPGTILGERALRTAIDATGLAAELKALEERTLIDWPAAAAAKHRLLQSLYEGFVQGEHPLHEDFSSFRHAAGEALETTVASKPSRRHAPPGVNTSTGGSGFPALRQRRDESC